jgi:hypothetical protein
MIHCFRDDRRSRRDWQRHLDDARDAGKRFVLVLVCHREGESPQILDLVATYKTRHSAGRGLATRSGVCPDRYFVLPLPLTVEEAFRRCGPWAGLYEIADGNA